jgi:hypothetical protein
MGSSQSVTSLEQPSLAFIADPSQRPAIEVRINFGIFAGRVATAAEIGRLAEWLLDIADSVTIVCEERHEIGGGTQASVHQLRIELAPDGVPDEPSERTKLEQRLLERCDYWARECIVSHPVPWSL